MDLENTNDIFDMSDDEFTAQYGTSESGSLVVQSDESTAVDSLHMEPEDTTEDEYIDVPEDEEEFDEADEVIEDEESYEDSDVSESEEDSEDEITEEDSFNFREEYSKIIGQPIKGAGKEITLSSTEEAIRLIQMGLGYHKRMEQLKPTQKLISMLESNNMLDESKLNYAIDLINKNPQAISRLVSEAGIDKYELDEEQGKTYVPTNHGKSDQEIALDNALRDIADTPTYAKTVNVLARQWDEKSRDMVKQNPNTIAVLNDHIASGIYDTVSNEVEKRKMLGTIPAGLSDIEAYKFVGDSLYANGNTQTAPQAQVGQQDEFNQATVKPPIKKPKRETVIKQKNATRVPRGNTSNRRNSVEDVFSMSDDEFIKKYGLSL